MESGRIEFVPANWSKTYFEWMRNIQDWCISRQLWWGHRIPAWYTEDGSIYVGRSEAEARSRNQLGDEVVLRQDEDVLDTWFSSALWPFSTLGWPQQEQALQSYYPTSVLVTGFDIIFFWVARMIMMGLKFMDDVPFHQVYITGLIRDHDGQKMSKSKGNILDPLDLIDGCDLETLIRKRTTGLMQPQMRPKIEAATRKQFPDGIPEFGTDALRFTFAALASNGRDIRFDLGRIEGYRNFCNKLWNAARYVMMNVSEAPQGDAPELSLADRWIRSRLGHTLREFEAQIAAYRLDLAARALYEFTWNEYCDWYLELAKPVLQGKGSAAEQLGTRLTLVEVLENLLRCLHPIMPFITEEIWQKLAPLAGVSGDTIMLQPFPDETTFPADPTAEQELAWVQNFILGLRQIRGEMDIAPGKPLPVLLQDVDATSQRRLTEHARYLTEIGRLESISQLPADQQAPPAATALLDGLRILVPMAGLIDVAAERQRLSKNLEKTRNDLKRVDGKLANRKFVDNAPAEVVGKERERAAALTDRLAQLEAQWARLETLE